MSVCYGIPWVKFIFCRFSQSIFAEITWPNEITIDWLSDVPWLVWFPFKNISQNLPSNLFGLFFFYLVQSFWIFLFCLNSVLGKIVFYVFCKLLCKISHIWHFPQLSRCQRNESFHGTSFFFLYLNHNKLVLCLWWGEFCASELEGNGHSFKNMKGLSWLWSYGSWIYKYLFNQCLSAL